MKHRSPVILCLLAAATISGDVVAWSLVVEEARFASLLYDGLIVGQLSVVCVASLVRGASNTCVPLFPWIAVFIASMATGEWPFGHRLKLWEGIPYYGLHCALLLAGLWVLQRTEFWRSNTGSKREWRYSLVHLLIVMALVAMLAGMIRQSRGGYWPTIAIFISGSAFAALASVASWILSQHVLIRAAGALGAALFFGFAASLAFAAIFNGFEMSLMIIFSTHYAIQVLVLSIWILAGGILMPPQTSGSEDS
jgi:hypothetical protein